MNRSTPKKRARELQGITGMSYQAAHLAVTNGTENQASIRSGLTLSDFVTPREQRIWHQMNHTGKVDCVNGNHWMPTEQLGQCVGCGTYLATEYDHDGNEHEIPVGEADFLEQCAGSEMYYNWAPPMNQLNGLTQREYFRRHWRSTEPDGYPRDETLTDTHHLLLRIVDDLTRPGHLPATRQVGERFVEAITKPTDQFPWPSTIPWHGTHPWADELCTAGLLRKHVGMAPMVAPGAPASEAQQYALEVTDAGRKALALTPA